MSSRVACPGPTRLGAGVQQVELLSERMLGRVRNLRRVK
jgi:hypothetical protein